MACVSSRKAIAGTQYPILLEDIADHLGQNDDFAIFSIGAAGDLVADIAEKQDYLWAIERAKANAMLLSGGGNDLFGDLGKVLLGYFPGATPVELIDAAAFDPLFDRVIGSYRKILLDVTQAHPNIVIFGHGYDLPFPLDQGNWIGPALKDKAIPFDVGREIIRLLMGRFNDSLKALDAEFFNFVFCDLREKVDRGPNSWFDELHPKNAGYGRAATVIENEIRSRTRRAGGAESAATTPSLNAAAGFGVEHQAVIPQTIVIDPGHGGTTAVGGSSPNNAVGPKGMLEKNVNLDIAKRARALLQERGFQVVLTREDDVNSSLAARANVAKSAQASVFVSLHFNGFDGSVQGTETFVHASLGQSGDARSRALCLALQAEMVAALGHSDRNAVHPGGVKLGNYGVINPSHHSPRTAAVLHEVSFMDVADEEERLANVSYRRKIAVALADGLESFLAGTLGAEFALAGAEPEFGDAFEFGLLHPELIVAETQADSSNGHRIADAQTGYSFLDTLATVEARFASGRTTEAGLRSEGNERSDASPAVRAAFGERSANAESNRNHLRRLFARVEPSSFDLPAFESFIISLGLRHFSPGEFLFLGAGNDAGKCTGKNTLPPQALWPRMKNTALMIDEIRERLGDRVFITSGYRSRDYNPCVGGVPGSQHLNFNALDWQCETGTPTQWRAVAEAVRASDPARFAGFIDDYDTFVHIDTRDT